MNGFVDDDATNPKALIRADDHVLAAEAQNQTVIFSDSSLISPLLPLPPSHHQTPLSSSLPIPTVLDGHTHKKRPYTTDSSISKTPLNCTQRSSSRLNGRQNLTGKHQHEYECHLVITPKTSKDNTTHRFQQRNTRSSLSAPTNGYQYPSSPPPMMTPTKLSTFQSNHNVIEQNSYGAVNHSGRALPVLTQHRSAHCHSPDEQRITAEQSSARRKLIISSVICLVFMVVEAVGGVLSGSLAILTDSAHLLSDFASFMIQLFAIWLASRARTTSMSFGWYRAETIGALTSIMVIWVVTGILVYIAIERIIRGDLQVNALLMLITSGFGILVNIIMAVALHPPHTHSHKHEHEHDGHSHDDHAEGIAAAAPVDTNLQTPLIASAAHVGRKPSGFLSGVNLNVRAALIHVIGDLVQSIGVFVAALLIYFVPGTEIADPICTFLFSVLVLLTTITILRDIINVLMEGSPRSIDFAQVQALLASIPGVVRIHNLRMWGLSMDKLAVNAHLVINADVANSRQVLHDALRSLHGTFSNLFETTIQIEEYEADMDDCTKCIEDDPAALIN